MEQAMSDAQGGAEQQQQQGEPAPPESLSFLQLQDAFKRMVAVGVDVVDEQAFRRLMAGVPPHLVAPMWQLYSRVVAGIVENALEEFESIAAEVGLRQQLADVEALLLSRRGAAGGGGGGGGGDAAPGACDAPGDGPEAAAAAARVAAKRAEKQQLQEMLARAQAQRDDLQSRVDARRRQADSLQAGYARVADQMGELHAAAAAWRADGLLPAAGPAAV
ncbi:hypothetical protein Rsub_08579 [Raphidocelis subcapitata]|uniref:Uncharacterized protein n=1 Tax=Raphidocelis subcapitata TaxID=307507 RepID=A0A2V0P6W2_9CHLO|nr:hypothetical protein Rsub_08579 [Raphidocelis subcapitata]|eukprot:GBF95598.1 hypothetical protein Rsub_08579 [Raphidocelis subcapitata]